MAEMQHTSGWDLARETWGQHPVYWPVPPMIQPRWWQISDRKAVKSLERVFGPLDAVALSQYWSEVAKGQSVYEDAGGYMIRCYAAMIGLPTEDPYTYEQATADLLAPKAGA